MSYQWFSVTLCYYGLSFASTNLSQHVWTDFLLRDPQTFITDLSLTLPSCILNHLLLTLLLPINLRKWIKSICSENSSAFLYCLLLTDDVWCAAQYRRWDPRLRVLPVDHQPAGPETCPLPLPGESHLITLKVTYWLPSDRVRPLLCCVRIPAAIQLQQDYQRHQAPSLSPGKVWSLGSVCNCLPLHGRALPHLHQASLSYSKSTIQGVPKTSLPREMFF